MDIPIHGVYLSDPRDPHADECLDTAYYRERARKLVAEAAATTSDDLQLQLLLLADLCRTLGEENSAWRARHE